VLVLSNHRVAVDLDCRLLRHFGRCLGVFVGVLAAPRRDNAR
jgi:hypothetical protein